MNSAHLHSSLGPALAIPRFFSRVLFTVFALLMLYNASARAAGERIVLPVLTDDTGKEHAPGTSPVVLAWTAQDCPMAKVYAPRLQALAKELAPRGVRFFLVDSNSDAPKIITQAGESIPRIRDERGELARLTGARSTTEVVVLDGGGSLVYRGAADDQYGFQRNLGAGAGTFRKDAPAQQFLKEAVEAVLAGKKPAVTETDPMGCLLEWTPAAAASATDGPVFYGGVERVFRSHCQECHRSGGNAPFALEKFESVRRRSRMILEVVDEHRMPPWAASPAHGHFSNDPSLSADEIAQLTRWIKDGTPAGEIAKALPALPERPEWEIGKPDAVFEAEPFEVAAEGKVPYRYVKIPTNLTEDRWVEATQIVSSAPEIVHHVLVFVDKAAPAAPGVKRPWTPHFDALSLLEGVKPEDRLKWIFRFAPYITKDMNVGGGGGLNGSFATSLAAGRGMSYPPGRAKLLPAGATIVLQIHYTPDGTKHESTTRLGLRFAKTPPTEPVDSRSLATVAFEIPPGDKAYQVTATRVMPRDALLLSLRPHMHVRGKSFRYIAEFPDGKEEILLDVPKWDFEWQVEYVLAEPRKLPKGTLLRAVATYDNSSENPSNPDPSKTVYFGLQSDEEMMIGYYEVVWGEDTTAPPAKISAAQ